MKQSFTILAIALLMASLALASCSPGFGNGDRRDINLEQALKARLDSIPYAEYVGMSDVRALDGNRLQAVIIFYAADSTGRRVERNVRVTADKDCSEIYTWENIDSKVLEDVRQRVNDKFEEKGIHMDGGLIDALIELKKR